MTELVDLRPEALHSKDAEAGVVGLILANPKVAGQVVAGARLEPEHFYRPAYRALYEQIVTAYYADDPIDPVSCGEPVRRQLAAHFGCDEGDAVTQLRKAVMGYSGARDDQATKHAELIRHHADRRGLIALSYSIQHRVAEAQDAPEQIAGDVSEQAMRIATSTMLTDELLPFEEVGRRYVRELRRNMLAKQAGVEIGAWFNLTFIDSPLRGLRPGELWFLAGEPGAGKSAVAWKAAERFAERQAAKPKDDQVAALVASLEMGEEPSSQRWAMSMTSIDGGKLRDISIDAADLNVIVTEWKARRDFPLILNHSSTIRLTQLRALTVEAIRRYKVGVVVIDHWKYLDVERRFQNPNDEDEAKARFLKQDLAKQLNVAVICLAHTTKAPANRDDKRPKMSDLRGSGYVAAHADFISFVHRPYKHATQDDIDMGEVKRTDAEMLWEKARHALDGAVLPFYFDPSRMVMY